MTTRPRLDEATFSADPIEQFLIWYAQARDLEEEADAAALATASADGAPSVRMVLLRGIDARGLVFFTNYESRKGADLVANPRAALAFHWPAMDRQVRVEGPVTRTSAAESEAYFRRRPVGSRLSAIVSPQSRVVDSLETLTEAVREQTRLHRPGAPPRPPHWGGFRMEPMRVEFWQSGRHRLHDRLEYVRSRSEHWTLQRLAP